MIDRLASPPRFFLASAACLATAFSAGLIALGAGCTKKTSSSSAPEASNEILVGEFGSFTGGEATFGLSTHKGIMMAVDELDAAGGIKGKPVHVHHLDNQGKPEEAASSVTRLIAEDHVIAILGEVASGRTLAAAPIAQRNKIPLITPSSTNPKVTEVGNYIFRVCFIDPFQGTVMARFASENLKAKRVAILRDVKSDYSEGLANFFAAKLKELGGEIVADESYSAGESDFKAQLTALRSKKPDAIFIPGYYTEVGLIARQARQLGIAVPLMGGDGWDSAKLYEIGQDAINGSYFSNHYTTESTDPAVKEFIKRFKEKYGETPDALAALGFDAAGILFDAMKRVADASPAGANGLTPLALRDAIAATKDYPGVTGKITIDAKRNATKTAVVVKIDGAINRFVRTVSP